MTRATYRFRNYSVTADDTAMSAYQAVCVTGDDADCGEDSGDQPDEAALTKWMAEHTRDTGHERFRQARWDYVTVRPTTWQ
ncbi:DUF7848 domain-containing protein [Streptomyces djakartensis]|uniref:DUF7848 domain-containing protein n=1 Tax=Streptomyces djakartensis TaxID=68193 RepID=UPI0034DFCB5D